MMNAQRVVRALARAGCALLLAACEVNEVSVLPTPAPTIALSLPTSSPSPFPTFATDRAALRQALANTRGSRQHRLQVRFTLLSNIAGRSVEQSFLSFDGEFKDGASRIVHNRSQFTEMLGGSERVEVLTLGGKTYMRGSNLYGATDASQWYLLGDSPLNQPPVDMQALLRLVNESGAQAQAANREQIDGVACEWWRMDLTGDAANVLEVATRALNREELNIADSAQVELAPCADGFVHRLRWRLDAHSAKDANEKVLVTLSLHYYDFNAPININAPEGALDLR